MFCPNCGSNNPEEAIFCQDCGKKIVTQKETSKVIKEEKIKQPLSRNRKIIIGEVIVLLLLIIAAYKVGEKKLGAEVIAKEYFQQVMNGDWEGVYDKLELTESPFLSKSSFVEANEGIGSQAYTNYNVEKGTALDSESKLSRTINISYHLKGETEDSTMVVKLIKQGKKKLFFFDNWKVIPDNYITEQYKIEVPKGTVVKMDDIKIDDRYRENEANTDSDKKDYYVIQKLFCGAHKLELKQANMEDVNVTVTTNEGSYYLDKMPIKKELKKELVKKAGEDLKTLYNNGLAQSDFSKVKSRFTKEKSAGYDLKNDYDLFKYNLQEYDNGGGLKSVSFSDVRGNVYYDENGSNTSFQVALNYLYNAKYLEYSIWDEQYNEDSVSRTGSNSITYTYEDDNWVIKDFDFEIVYY